MRSLCCNETFVYPGHRRIFIKAFFRAPLHKRAIFPQENLDAAALTLLFALLFEKTYYSAPTRRITLFSCNSIYEKHLLVSSRNAYVLFTGYIYCVLKRLLYEIIATGVKISISLYKTS